MNKKGVIAIIILSLLFFISFIYMIKADTLSVNSGGSDNIVVTPDQFTEGIFSQIPSSSTSTSPSPTGGGTTSGTGGGSVSPSQNANIIVSPTEFNVNMLTNTNLQKFVSVTNLGTTPLTVSISQSNLTNMIILGNTTLTIAPGQTQILNLIFVAPGKVGTYTGSISVGGVTIPVTLNVQKQLLLFDSNIVVLNKNYQVYQGSPLQTEVTLIPMGENVRTDVTLYYTIKDYNGTTFLTRSETLLVTNQISLMRNFDTGSLPIGKYVIDLELVYPNGVAPSSAYFEVVKATSNIFSLLVYYLIIAIVLVSILIIILIILRTVRKLRHRQ